MTAYKLAVLILRFFERFFALAYNITCPCYPYI